MKIFMASLYTTRFWGFPSRKAMTLSIALSAKQLVKQLVALQAKMIGNVLEDVGQGAYFQRIVVVAWSSGCASFFGG
jgi:hypothetical protein